MTDGNQKKPAKYQWKSFVKDFAEERAEKKREMELLAQKKTLGIWIKKSGRIIAALILAVSLIFLARSVFSVTTILTKPACWVSGHIKETDHKLLECLNRMWEIRRALDEYYAKNKEYPFSLAEIYDNKLYLKTNLTCPASGNRYIVKEEKNKRIYCCPNPRQHGVMRIWAGMPGGPPTIEREEE